MTRYQKRYERKKALGLCRSGGCTNEPKPGAVVCQRCLEHKKQYHRSAGYVLDSSIPPAGYLPPRDVAKALGVWWNTVYRWIRQGAPHSRRYGRVWLNLERVKSWRASHDV
jgi:hypothetical protein